MQIMPNFKFELKRKNESITAIRFFFYYNARRVLLTTSQSIEPMYWNFETQRAIIDPKADPQLKLRLKNINTHLDNLCLSTTQYFATISLARKPFNEMELRKQLEMDYDPQFETNNRKSKYGFANLMEKRIEGMENGSITIKDDKNRRYTPTLIKDYKDTLNILQRLDSKYHKQFGVLDILDNFYEKLMEFLNEQDYKDSYKEKQVKNLNALLNPFFEDAILKENTDIDTNILLRLQRIQKKEFKKKGYEKTKVYLNETEIELMYNLDLSKNKSLEATRDLFVLGACIGQRISDYNTLEPHNYKNTIEGQFLEFVTKKTNAHIAVPIKSMVIEILQKYNFNLPIISEQVFNRNIKKVAMLACINETVTELYNQGGKEVRENKPKWQMVSSHTARISAVTNMYYSGMPKDKIMFITGHSSIEQLNNYIVIDPKREANKLQMHEQQFFKPTLKVLSKYK